LLSDNFHISEWMLSAWLGDRLSDTQSLQVELHLERCDACARKLDDYPVGSKSLHDLLHAPHRPHAASGPLADQAAVQSLSAGPRQGVDAAGSPPSDQRWQRERLLAKGGIGEIWIARDQLFDRPVALKCLRPETADLPSVQRRFLLEAHITAELNHPGTPYVLDVHNAGSDSYYVMSLVEGQTLTMLINRFHRVRISDPEQSRAQLIVLLNAFISAAQTIAFAHLRGVIHRDIKSENVVIGDYGQVTVIDWGLAKRLHLQGNPRATDPFGSPTDNDTAAVRKPHSSPMHHTHAGMRLGTPAFMAPEQVRCDNASLDHRTDVYGLAAMLYEIVTGRPPFVGLTNNDVFAAVLTQPPPRFARLGINSLDKLEAICFRGLSKNPQDRQRSAGSLATAIQQWIVGEADLKSAEKMGRSFFSGTAEMLAIVNRKAELVWANPACAKVLGWSQEELQHKTREEMLHPDDQVMVEKALRRVYAGQAIEAFEPRMLCKDGSYRWISWTSVPAVNDSLYYFIGRDVDQRRRRERRFASILDATPDGVVVVSSDRKIQYVNRQMLDLFGYEEVDLIGQPLETLIPRRFHQSHPGHFTDYLRRPAEQRDLINLSLVGRHHDGTELPVFISLRSMKTDAGPHFTAVVRPNLQPD